MGPLRVAERVNAIPLQFAPTKLQLMPVRPFGLINGYVARTLR